MQCTVHNTVYHAQQYTVLYEVKYKLKYQMFLKLMDTKIPIGATNPNQIQTKSEPQLNNQPTDGATIYNKKTNLPKDKIKMCSKQ